MAISPDTLDAPYNLGVSLIALGGPGLEEVKTLWGAAAKQLPHFKLRLANAGGWAQQALKTEEYAVLQVAETRPEGEGDGPEGAARRAKIPGVVKSLRAVEQSVSKIIMRFRSIFWLDADSKHPTKQRPLEQIDQKSLAYGSTFFQSWHSIVANKAVTAALRYATAEANILSEQGTLRQAPDQPGRGLVVLGSSIGYFPILAHLLFGTPTVGYDLLCSDVAEANRVVQKHKIDASPGTGVRFFCQDGRDAELSEATVIWLNAAVWSVATRSAIYAKITAEVQEGALVIDYHDSLATALADSPFELIHTTVVPTSWNPESPIYVMQRVGNLIRALANGTNETANVDGAQPVKSETEVQADEDRDL